MCCSISSAVTSLSVDMQVNQLFTAAGTRTRLTKSQRKWLCTIPVLSMQTGPAPLQTERQDWLRKMSHIPQ
ncbi:hypothetical protein LDENG_00259230 [Lucifuga dentata]|nr:hypothetical protein LDENG_00259230 [Lucifuga dentata]